MVIKMRSFFIIACVLIAILAISSSSRTIELPKPTGKFNIGRASIHLTDTSRQEQHNPKNNRELLLQIWYPAHPISNNQKAFYAPLIANYIENDIVKATQKPQCLTYLKTLKGNAVDDEAVSNDKEHYPVIIFSPGFGSPIVTYTSLLEDLASHGYIVIGINHPYVTNPVIFPDGRIIEQLKELTTDKDKEFPTWINDISFVIDQLDFINNDNVILKNKLDIKSIGIFGHSFGGSTALAVCSSDNRCKAGIDLDGKIRTPVKRLDVPFLFLVAPHDENELKSMKDLAESHPTIVEYKEIKDINHGSFTDLYLLADWPNKPKLDPKEAIKITRKSITDFFNANLQHPSKNIKLTPIFVQAETDSPLLTTIISTLSPLINKIIKEELGLETDYNFDFFLPKQRHPLTLYSFSDVNIDGEQYLVSALDIKQKFNTLLKQNISPASEVDFFFSPLGTQDELIIKMHDPDALLSQINSEIKKIAHQINKNYKQTHQYDLYDVKKSEQYPYIPHIGLGRIRSSSINQNIKDKSQAAIIEERIKHRIKDATQTVIKELLAKNNQKLSFNKICVFDLQTRKCLKEYW